MRVTGPLIKVLVTLLANAGQDLYGLEISRSTKLKSGTLYPLLDRLEAAGWVTSRWETADPSAVGRPRKRFYALTGAGAHEARQLLLEHSVGDAAWT